MSLYYSATDKNLDLYNMAVETTVELLDGREIDIRWHVDLSDDGVPSPERFLGSRADVRTVILRKSGEDVPVADVERLSGRTWGDLEADAILKAADKATEGRK